MYSDIHMYTHICIYTYMHIHTYIYACIHVHTNKAAPHTVAVASTYCGSCQQHRDRPQKKITILSTKNHPLQQSPCQKLLAARRIHFQLSPMLQPAMNSSPNCY